MIRMCYRISKEKWHKITVLSVRSHLGCVFCLLFIFNFFSILKKCNCNMESVQHEKKCNMKKVQHEKGATWKKCNMKRVQHEKGATWKKCNMEKVQDGNSRRVARTLRTSKMESFATVFNGFVNCCEAPHLRCLRGSRLHLWK